MSYLTPLLAALVLGPGPAEDAAGERPAEWTPAHPSHAGAFGAVEPEVQAKGADRGRSLSRTVFGFLPYWTGSTYLQYDLISVLALFSVEMDQYGSVWAWHGFPGVFSEEIASIHSAGGQAVVTVTNFDSDEIHLIITENSQQARETMCDLVTETNVDGVCIDFEQMDGDDRDNLTAFVENLRADLDAQAPGSHLSVCTPAVDWSGAFDYSALAASCDALFIMCYPFHGSWSSVAGPCCPLVGWGGPESSTNMAWCLGDYVINAPEAHDRIVVGLPYYGHQWETEDQYTHSAVTGGCSTLIYSTLADRAETYGRLWDGESQTPWYAFSSGGWNQGWFDDEESLELKYDMIRAADLQGVGIWALGYDGSRPELWDCLEESFASGSWQDSITDNLESRFTLHGPSQYWHQSTSAGEVNGLFYTYSISSAPDVNWAEWRFALPDSSGQYALSAYVPDYGAEAEARYRICHGGGEDTVVVDQAGCAGGWADLGGPYSAEQGLRVVLGDCTGSTGQRIVYDAVRFEAVSAVEGHAAGIGTTVTAASPCRSGALRLLLPASEHRRTVSVFDASGRVVLRRSWPAGPQGWKTVDGRLPAGVVLVLMESGTRTGTARAVVLP